MYLITRPTTPKERSDAWSKAINRAERRGFPGVAQELREWAYEESTGRRNDLTPIHIEMLPAGGNDRE